jgi:flagellar biosynthesis protein FlhG
MTIVPIASGKGGVGKSLLAANVGILLAKSGKRVVLADLDFGGSNLHLILGTKANEPGIGTFLTAGNMDFGEIIRPTDYGNLRFIAGDNELPGIANLSAGQKRKLISRLRNVDADILILDLGAGTSFNVMDFFLLSRRGIIVTTPTPTALVNAYLCIKNALFRLLTSHIKRGTDADTLLKELSKNAAQMQRLYLPNIVGRLEGVAPEAIGEFRAAAEKFRPRIVINMLDDPKEVNKLVRLRASCAQYLGIEVEQYGVLYRDELQDIALNARLPIVLYKPKSILSSAVGRIAERLAEESETEDGEVWIDADESFEAAVVEAENDFDAKADYVNELLDGGVLTHGDLLETVKSQQIEIRHLRKQNELLSSKLVKAAKQGYKL